MPIKSKFIIGDYHVPVFLHREVRNSVRFAIGKKGLTIRGPILINTEALLKKAEQWCTHTAQKKPQALRGFLIKDYAQEFTLNIYGKSFIVKVKRNKTDRDIIQWKADEIRILINNEYSREDTSKTIKELLIKFSSKRFLPIVRKRVHHLNEKHFGVTIKNVRLKYNYSNWGSCSAKGNINLSTKLLLASQQVIDYVIIHELAHRLEMNHSDRFWKIVSNVCPEYKVHERWLKENSHICDF